MTVLIPTPYGDLEAWTTSDPANLPLASVTMMDSVDDVLTAMSSIVGTQYRWANKAARDAQAGMVIGNSGYQIDVDIYWFYDGIRWQPTTTTAFASLAVLNTQIPTPVTGMTARIATDLWARKYNGTAWKPYGSGLLPIKPPLVTGGGTIGTDGAVTVATSGTSVTLRGIFSADFDDYLIMGKLRQAAGSVDIFGRLNAAGVDLGAGTPYLYNLMTQTLVGTPTRDSNGTANEWKVGFSDSTTVYDRFELQVLDPFSTAGEHRYRTRSESASGFIQYGGGRVTNVSSYDSFTFFTSASTLTGNLRVYGYNAN